MLELTELTLLQKDSYGEQVVLELYDLQGNSLLKEPENDGFEGEAEWISWQAPGFYAVKVSDKY